MNKIKGFSITELLVGLILVVFVIGGALKIFSDSQKTTSKSLSGMMSFNDMGNITNALHKALTMDSKIMFASSANINSRPENGMPISLPVFIPQICRDLKLPITTNSVCAHHYSMVFAGLGSASAAAICVATPAEMNQVPFSSEFKNGRYIIFDYGHEIFGSVTSSGSSGGGEEPSSVGQVAVSQLEFDKALYIWNAPQAWAIMPIKNNTSPAPTQFNIDRVNEINLVPQRCRSSISTKEEHMVLPLVALAVEPLFISQLTGERARNSSGEILQYPANFLDANISMPTKVGQLDFKTLGFAFSSANSNITDFGISKCEIDGGNLNCEEYPAQIGMSETTTFKTELTFSKRLGNDPVEVTSYQLGLPSESAGVFTQLSTTVLQPGVLWQAPNTYSWPVSASCGGSYCRVLPLYPPAEFKRYENTNENEYNLESAKFSGLKAYELRGIRFIIAISNRVKEFYLALP